MKKSLLFAPCAIALFASVVIAEESARYAVSVEVARPCVNTPVVVDVLVPKALEAASVTLKDAKGAELPAQLTAPSLLAKPLAGADGQVHRQVTFLLTHAGQAETLGYEATIAPAAKDAKPSASGFAWLDDAGKSTELSYAGHPVLRYMYEPIDESSPKRRFATFKAFHHVFSPDGTVVLTNGGGEPYPHHRGLFFGFNRVSYGDGKAADVWHCTKGSHQRHEKLLSDAAGPVLGRQLVEISWHGNEKDAFAKEERELTAYRPTDAPAHGFLLEFASKVSTLAGPISLKGDPQHSGFHFRASHEVAAKTKAQTYYLRVDGVGQPGEYRNWPDRKDQVNFPWKGMSFMLGDKRYTVANLDRPENPKESRFSERDYGRFGSYFEYDITPEKPLEVNYRVWVQDGDMTVEQIAALDADFVTPPKATAKAL